MLLVQPLAVALRRRTVSAILPSARRRSMVPTAATPSGATSVPASAPMKPTSYLPGAARLTLTLPTPMPANPSSAACTWAALLSAASGPVLAVPKLSAKGPLPVSSTRCVAEVVAPVLVSVSAAAGARTGVSTASSNGIATPSAAPPKTTRHCCAAVSSVTIAVPPSEAKLLPAGLVAASSAAPTWAALACASKAAVVKVLPWKEKSSCRLPCTAAGIRSMRCTEPVATPPAWVGSKV